MIIIVMGVSGSGKTTIGELLAKSLNWEFSDADSFHPSSNIEKMSHGISLDDNDRLPWLQAIESAMSNWLETQHNVVLACSALKATYRHLLHLDDERVKLVYLKGSYEMIAQRMAQRENHFMKLEMLKSQFATLEEPNEGIKVDISKPVEKNVQEIRKELGI